MTVGLVRNLNYGLIVGKVGSQLLLLMVPLFLRYSRINTEDFYENLFIYTVSIFTLRMGREYFLYNDEDDTNYLSAQRTLRAVLLILIVIIKIDLVIPFLLMNLGSVLTYQLMAMRIKGYFRGWPYFFEGLVALIFSVCALATPLSLILSCVAALVLFFGRYSIQFAELRKGIGVMSNTAISLLVTNVLPLMTFVNLELFYIYSRASGIITMASTYGNLLYQREDNQLSIQKVRRISIYQLPIFIMGSLVYTLYLDVSIVWTFILAPLVNVITGPVQIDLYRLKKSHKVFKASLVSFIVFLCSIAMRLDSMLYVGLAFSAILIVENVTSFLFYEQAKNSRS